MGYEKAMTSRRRGIARALEFTASRFQEQTDHLHSLAKCGDLIDAMKCQLEFVQQLCSRSFGEVSKVFERLRMASPTSS